MKARKVFFLFFASVISSSVPIYPPPPPHLASQSKSQALGFFENKLAKHGEDTCRAHALRISLKVFQKITELADQAFLTQMMDVV